METKPGDDHEEDVEPATESDFPDPDEDDLDDLDDLLDQFSAAKIEDNSSAPSNTSAPTTAPPTGPEIPDLDGISDEDFAKQFQASMAELMGEMNNNPELASQFEAMMKELASASQISEPAGMSPGPSPSAPKTGESAKKAAPAAAGASEESFQGKIKKTMERMQESGQKASDAAAADDSEDMLAEIMKQIAAGGGMEGEGGEEEFSKMLLGMMEQLTHKQILYEPMKELNDKYPEWMEKNKDKISKEELTRFQEQQVVVKEIVDRFESKTYSDSNAADREYIVERMQKMQGAGAPPADLVGDMSTAQEAFGAPEEGCPQQ